MLSPSPTGEGRGEAPLQFTIYLQFNNLAIYRAVANSSFLILHLQRAAERSNFDFSLFTFHFAEGDGVGLGGVRGSPFTIHAGRRSMAVYVVEEEPTCCHVQLGWICRLLNNMTL